MLAGHLILVTFSVLCAALFAESVHRHPAVLVRTARVPHRVRDPRRASCRRSSSPSSLPCTSAVPCTPTTEPLGGPRVSMLHLLARTGSGRAPEGSDRGRPRHRLRRRGHRPRHRYRPRGRQRHHGHGPSTRVRRRRPHDHVPGHRVHRGARALRLRVGLHHHRLTTKGDVMRSRIRVPLALVGALFVLLALAGPAFAQSSRARLRRQGRRRSATSSSKRARRSTTARSRPTRCFPRGTR